MAYNTGNSKLVKFMASTALERGGVITQGTGTTTINISSGLGVVSNPDGKTIAVIWDDFVNVELDHILTAPFTTISIDNTGAIVQKAGTLTDSEERASIRLGFITHIGLTAIENIASQPILLTNGMNSLNEFGAQFGNINSTGNLISPAATDLTIQKSAGSVFSLGINYDLDPTEPNTFTSVINTGVEFIYSYRDGSGGFANTILPQVDVDTAFYDDGSGTLASVANNRYTIQRLYWFAKSNVYVMTYGQELYTTLEDAILGSTTENPTVSPSLAGAAVRSFISTKGNVSDLTNTSEASFLEGPKFLGAGGGGSSSGGGASLPTTTQGDLITYEGTDVRLGIGTEGQLLTAIAGSVAWADAGDGDVTRVQSGLNTFTGGTINSPTVNVSALTIDNITVSGTSAFETITSGGTDLSTIFAASGDPGDVTRVQGGLNTYTGGTINDPTINVSALTIDNLTVTGSSTFADIEATTITSGGTDLGDVFAIAENTIVEITATSTTITLGNGMVTYCYFNNSTVGGITINGDAFPIGGAIEICQVGSESASLIAGANVNLIGVIDLTTTTENSLGLRRLNDDSFGLTGSVFMVY